MWSFVMQDLRAPSITIPSRRDAVAMAVLAPTEAPARARPLQFRTFTVSPRKLGDRDRSDIARLSDGLAWSKDDALAPSGGRFLLAKTQDDGILGYGCLQPAVAPAAPCDGGGAQGQCAAAPLPVWVLGLVVDRDCMARFGCRPGAVARRLVAEALQFAWCNGIAQYRVVASPEVEHLLFDEGVVLHQPDASMPIDAQGARFHVLDVDARTLGALGVPLPTAPAVLPYAEPGLLLADPLPAPMRALMAVLVQSAAAALSFSAARRSRMAAARSQRSGRG
jgi:hypothetical protein